MFFGKENDGLYARVEKRKHRILLALWWHKSVLFSQK